MVYNVITNKKWQKVAFIIASMGYVIMAILAFTSFKRLSWYQDVRTFLDQTYYHVFQILGIIVILRAGIQYYEDHDNTILETIPIFVFEHFLLAFIFIFFIIDFNTLMGVGALRRAYTLRALFYILLAGSQYDYEEYLPWLSLASLAMMVACIVCSKQGMITDVLYKRSAVSIGHSLGYVWPLTFHAHFLILVLLYLVIRREHFTIWEMLILLAANTYIGLLTTAKTAMILAYVVVILAYVLHFDPVREKLSALFQWAYAFVIGIPVISMLCSIIYNGNLGVWTFLDRVLNNRLRLQHNAFRQYGFAFLGRNVKWVSFGTNAKSIKESDYNYVDNTFLKTGYDYGLGLLLFFVAGFAYSIHTFIKKENYTGVLCIVVLFLLGILQHQPFEITFNPLIFTFAPLFLVTKSDITSSIERIREAS